MRFHRVLVATKIGFLWAGCLLLASPAAASLVYASAHGGHLDGATITITFQNAGAQTPVVIAGVGTSASASVTDLFSFSITGGTFTADWTLTNDLTGDFITQAVFDLTNSVSLFDTSGVAGVDGVNSTLNSEIGDRGVVPQGGPTPLVVSPTQTESVLWPDVDNLGDMWLVQTLNWGENDFGFTETATWLDDTDTTVPEPATMFLMGGGLLAIGLLRRHRASRTS